MNKLLLAVLVTAFGVTSAPGAEFPWSKNEESARKAAKSGKKLLMIDFYADW